MVNNKYEIDFKDGFESKSTDQSQFISKMKKEWSISKQKKQKRATEVQYNIGQLRKIIRETDEGSNRFSGQISANRTSDFVSPVLAAVIEAKASSDWIPDINFEQQKTFKGGGDVFLARNSTTVHDSVLEEGHFYREARKGGIDLFTKGRVFFQKGYKLGEDGIPELIEFKHVDWEKVYKNKEVYFVLDSDFTAVGAPCPRTRILIPSEIIISSNSTSLQANTFELFDPMSNVVANKLPLIPSCLTK